MLSYVSHLRMLIELLRLQMLSKGFDSKFANVAVKDCAGSDSLPHATLIGGAQLIVYSSQFTKHSRQLTAHKPQPLCSIAIVVKSFVQHSCSCQELCVAQTRSYSCQELCGSQL